MIRQLRLILLLLHGTAASLHFKVPEDAPKDTLIGYIDGPSTSTELNYLIVYPDNATEQALHVDDATGVIRVSGPLDYETVKKYDVLAIPLKGGEGIQIAVAVTDVNDNGPTFSHDKIELEISEVARRGHIVPLPPAEDADSPPFDVQSYTILRGNVNNVFKLQTRRIEGKLRADLEVNGQLDREYRENYGIVVEARDGGDPPKSAQITANIRLLDVNDNAPKFGQANYSDTVATNASLSTPILTVSATDIDAGENARVSYRLANVREETDSLFTMAPNGSLYPAVPLVAGHYEMVVIAADGGSPPLEGTAFIRVQVQQIAQPTILFDIVWLTEDGRAALPENSTLGSIVARLSVMPPDPRVHLEMAGCPALCMRETDQLHVYLLSICAPMDRESIAENNVIFSLRRGASETVMEHPLTLEVLDINDNAPFWPTAAITIKLNRSREDTVDLSAMDLDTGENGRISYSILGSDAVTIDAETGRVRLTDKSCAPLSRIAFTVVATDGGTPPLNSTLSVTADITQSPSVIRCTLPLYETTIREDLHQGSCILEIGTWSENGLCDAASQPSKLKYVLRGDDDEQFIVDQKSGQICIRKPLDYEKRPVHEMSIELHQEGSSTFSDSCGVSIRIEDVNDNAPAFSPLVYKASLGEQDAREPKRLLKLAATDADEGVFGEVRYKLVDSAGEAFRLNDTTGWLESRRRLAPGLYKMEAVAVDGGEKEGIETAMIEVRVLAQSPAPLSFLNDKPVSIEVSEDILPGIEVGSVMAIGPGNPRYSFYSGDPHHYFAVDPETGKVSVLKYLDSDAGDGTMIINVQASLSGGESAYTQLHIAIADHNDNSPVFPTDSVTVRVREDHPVDKALYVINARDKDRGKNGAVSYALLSSTPVGPFLVHPLTGQLKIGSTLDYETVTSYRLRIRATDAGIPPRSANLTIMVYVLDVNDNPPVFAQGNYSAKIVENSPSQSPVITVRASDRDSGPGGAVEYSLTGEHAHLFSIDTRSGAVATRKELDREARDEYNITVVARDRGVPPLSASALIRVEVLDVNDNAPSCSSIQPMTVPLTADNHKPIGTMVAHDSDAGVNGTLTYRTQQHSSLFLLKANGDVFIRRDLSREEGSRLTLPVFVSDGGMPPKSTLCQVSIQISAGEPSIVIEGDLTRDVYLPSACPAPPCPIVKINATGVKQWRLQSSDISPSLSIAQDGLLSLASPLPTVYVRALHVVMEDHNGRQKMVHLRVHPARAQPGSGRRIVRVPSSIPLGSQVIAINEDKEEEIGVFYQLMNKTDLLELDQARGVLYLTSSLLSRVGSSLDLVVRRSSIDGLSVEDEALVVEVEGDLPIRPVFGEEIVRKTVAENVAIGSPIHRLEANASEGGALILYRIADDDDLFLVDASTGVVTLQQSLEGLTGSDLYINAVAEIDGVESSSVIILTITDGNNHAPVFVSPSTVRVREESTKHAPFHHVVAVDRDHGDNGKIVYSLGGDASSFAIDSETGALSMKGRVSADVWITVKASDKGTPPSTAEQRLHVIVEHAKWRFFDSPSHKVRVHSTLPRHPLLAFPRQTNVKLSLLPRAAPFEVTGGELKAKANLTEKEYRLTVFAEREVSGDSDWMSIIVSVGQEPSPLPQISTMSCQAVTIPENVALKSFKRIVAASRGKNATFKIKSGNDGAQFAITPDTGEISCKELDREKKAEHLVVVSLMDDTKDDSCTIRIRVRDDNDNPPLLLTKDEIVLRDSKEVASLSAEDPDEGANGRVSFEMHQDPSEVLDITPNGKVFIARKAKYHHKSWTIKVRLFDHGASQSLESIWELTVRDERPSTDAEAKPAFLRAHYAAAVEEGRSQGVHLLTVGITERDAPLTYSIVQGNVDFAFDIDERGSISTAQELDREIRGEYSLTIMATAAHFKEVLTTHVDVTVLNANDNPPTVQTPSRRKVSEDTPPGTFITTISATDVDEDAVLEYSIEQPSPLFSIDRYTGVIHTAAPLDYEKQPEIQLPIVVSDGVHHVSTTLVVSVLDVNDNAPVFGAPFYDVLVPSTLGPNAVIRQLTATDADSDEKTRIEYVIISTPDQPLPFKIDAFSGHLIASSPSSLRGSYLFSVQATDNGTPPRSALTSVRVRSARGSAASPFFAQNFYKFTITENSPAWTLLGNVSVSEHPLNYRIADQSLAADFHISEYGLLFASKSLDREVKASYRFRIEVGDTWNSAAANASATISIDVADENDNAPVFDPPSPIVISEDMKRGDIIQRLSATDKDDGENGTVTYSIVSGNDYSVFVLDSATGALKFNEWSDAQLLASPTPYAWEMRIVARDGGRPAARSALHVLKIQVRASTWTAAAPFFPLPAYNLFVSENAPAGTVVLRSHPISRIGVALDGTTYTLHDADRSLFTINPSSGYVTLVEGLDYEKRTEHDFTLSVTDVHSRSAVVSVTVHVLPVDDYAPVFSASVYTFKIPLDSSGGQIIGRVQASDEDRGDFGRVSYRLGSANRVNDEMHSIIEINVDSGEIVLKEPLPPGTNHSLEQIAVIASSGPLQQSSAVVYLEIGDLGSRPRHHALRTSTIVVGSLVLLFFVLLLVVLIGCVCARYRYQSTKDLIDASRKQVYSIKREAAAPVMADIERTSPTFALPSTSAQHPQRSSMILSADATRSTTQHSIKDILSNRSQPDSGIDPDNCSINSSVTEYLASIGVTFPIIPNHQRASPLTEEERAVNEIIYARVDDILPPGPLNISGDFDILDHYMPSTTFSFRNRSAPKGPPPFQPLSQLLAQMPQNPHPRVVEEDEAEEDPLPRLQPLPRKKPREYTQITV